MSDLATVEIEIETAKNMIKQMEALTLLQKNKYFKEVIGEGYFKYEMNRLVMLKGTPLTDDIEKQVDKMITGIASLNDYFNGVNRRGQQMIDQLKSCEKTREELLVEEVA